MADLSVAIALTAQDRASAAIRGVENALGGLGDASKAAQTILPGVTVAAAGLTAGLLSTVGAAAEFEKTMSGVKAVMAPEEVNQFGGALQDLALRLGKETAFSAKEAAAGIEELVKGGLSATDILNGAADATLNLAAAGGVSLPDAATIAANALAEFNLAGEDMAHVADLIAGAANASALDVGQFKFSLQAAGAVAATVGFSFDDLAEAIAVMGKAGITSSDAGTSLKTMMLNLQPSTKAQVAEFERLGIVSIDYARATQILTAELSKSAAGQNALKAAQKDGIVTADELHKAAVKLNIGFQDIEFEKWASQAGLVGNQFFDASGKVRSMADVAGILQNATKDLTEQQRLASLEILFGSDAIRAAAVLSKEGAAGFNEMAASMGKVAAADVAGKRLDNLAGSLEQLKGSVEAVQIVIGQQLLPIFRPLVDGLTGILNKFLELDPSMQRVVAIGALVVTGLTVLTAAGLGLLAILPAIVAGFGAVATIGGVVAGVLTGPVVLAIGAVVVASALLAKAWTEDWGGIQEKTQAVWGVIGPIFAAIGEWLSDVAAVILPEAEKAWTNVTATIQRVWSALWEGYLQPAFASFQGWWNEHWDTISRVASTVWDVMTLGIRVAWDLIQGLIVAGLRVLQGDWAGAWDAMAGALSAAWADIRGTLGNLVGVIGNLGGQVLGAALDLGQSIVEGLIRGIQGGIRAVGNAAANLAKSALNSAMAALGIGSPSREFEKVGRWSGDGLVAGLRDRASAVRAASEELATAALSGTDEVVEGWTDAAETVDLASKTIADAIVAVMHEHDAVATSTATATTAMQSGWAQAKDAFDQWAASQQSGWAQAKSAMASYQDAWKPAPEGGGFTSSQRIGIFANAGGGGSGGSAEAPKAASTFGTKVEANGETWYGEFQPGGIFVPYRKAAAGMIATRPTMAMIAEGGEPEMVLPLSKAPEMGFGGWGGGGRPIEIHVHVAGSVQTHQDLTRDLYQSLLELDRRNGGRVFG